ncbi:MAG: hypothetical protein HRT35_02630 [Algicola sp.]|nr:hypothetical protein [Algicola sp.]
MGHRTLVIYVSENFSGTEIHMRCKDQVNDGRGRIDMMTKKMTIYNRTKWDILVQIGPRVNKVITDNQDTLFIETSKDYTYHLQHFACIRDNADTDGELKLITVGVEKDHRRDRGRGDGQNTKSVDIEVSP